MVSSKNRGLQMCNLETETGKSQETKREKNGDLKRQGQREREKERESV